MNFSNLANLLKIIYEIGWYPPPPPLKKIEAKAWPQELLIQNKPHELLSRINSQMVLYLQHVTHPLMQEPYETETWTKNKPTQCWNF